MNTGCAYETIARQRMDETARQARTAYQRREIKTRAAWHFPKISWPARPGSFTPHPA